MQPTIRDPRVYLAGPDLFFSDAERRYAALKSLCADHGLVGVAPTDGAPSVDPIPNGAILLYRHDIALLESCHAVLANITPLSALEPDSGTAYEIGYAAAIGLPVATYCLDGLDTRQRALRAGGLINAAGRDSNGSLVEDFGLHANLMLCAEHPSFQFPTHAVAHLVATLRDAADHQGADPRDRQAEQIADLAMLVKRLAREVGRRNEHGDSANAKIADRAMDYLRRQGLDGKPPLAGDADATDEHGPEIAHAS